MADISFLVIYPLGSPLLRQVGGVRTLLVKIMAKNDIAQKKNRNKQTPILIFLNSQIYVFNGSYVEQSLLQ